MNIVGKWKLKGLNIPTADGAELYTVDNYPEEYEDIFNENKDMVLEFCADGTYNMIMEAVGEIAETAEAEGYPIREDGYVVVDSATWEDRDGTIFYDSQAEGTILDEEIDPFIELGITEDGCILFNYGMMLFERM